MANSILGNIKVNSVDETTDNYFIELEAKSNAKKNCPYPGHSSGSVKDIINTGFAVDDSLSYKPCDSKNPLSQPLYKENFLSEFLTEDEQRAARRNLGLFDEHDVVAMSLLTTGDKVEDTSTLSNILIQVLEKGAKPVAILTIDKAVYVKLNNNYVTLDNILKQLDTKIEKTNTRIDSILSRSQGDKIETLGDLKFFLKGVDNSTTLLDIVDGYLKFESTGEIEQIKWQ